MLTRTYRKKLERWGYGTFAALFLLAFLVLADLQVNTDIDTAGLRSAGYLVNGEQQLHPSGQGYLSLYTTDQIEAAVAEGDCDLLRAIHNYTDNHEGNKYPDITTYISYVMGQIC